MKIEFDPPRIEKDYYNFKANARKFGKQFAEQLEDLLNFIENADNALDIKSMMHYKMHVLHGDMQGAYSLSPDNKKSKWRIVAICIDNNGNEIRPSDKEIEFLKGVRTLRLRKIGDYHD